MLFRISIQDSNTINTGKLRRISIQEKNGVDNGKLLRVSIQDKQTELSGSIRRISIQDQNSGSEGKLRRISIQDNLCIECVAAERALSFAVRISLPIVEEPDKGFAECAYDNLVLASLDSTESYKNDFNSFYFKKQSESDSCDFVLIEKATGDEYYLNDSTYGVYVGLGGYEAQPDLTTYKVEWRKVLDLLGDGYYQIRKDMTVAGIVVEEYSNTFHLEHFNNEIADEMVRIDTVMNGELVHLGVDFKGTNYTDSIRTGGYFGHRNPKYKQDNLVRRTYEPEQISMSQENEYQYQTDLLPYCITHHLYDFILFGNQIFMSDYNLSNHSYEYQLHPVELVSNKGAKYYPKERHSRVNLTFTDRKKDRRKLNCD